MSKCAIELRVKWMDRVRWVNFRLEFRFGRSGKILVLDILDIESWNPLAIDDEAEFTPLKYITREES